MPSMTVSSSRHLAMPVKLCWVPDLQDHSPEYCCHGDDDTKLTTG